MMRYRAHRIFGIATALLLILSLMIPMAGAAVDASDYFSTTDSVVIPSSGGSLIIEADCATKEVMSQVGVESIILYERQSDGTYDEVREWTRYNTSGMISSNNIAHFKSVTYQGTVGTKYFAAITFYAKNYSGLSETLTFDTEIVTAAANP